MPHNPLVSIIMPAYNAEHCIAIALQSLVLQTYDNWECIVVDDGSSDNTSGVVSQFSDRRIRLIKFQENRGRPKARQVALDQARGELLAMLDADDWIYPEKLACQVKTLQGYPEVALVSAGMAIVDSSNNLIGVRCLGSGLVQTNGRSLNVPVPHGPSMLRMSQLGTVRYNERLKLAQDSDFLRRYLQDKKYILLPDILYVYSESASVSSMKVIRGYYYNLLAIIPMFRSNAVAVLKEVIQTLFKALYVIFFTLLGRFEKILKDRVAEPSDRQLKKHLVVRSLLFRD